MRYDFLKTSFYYIKRHVFLILTFVASVLIFAMVFSLYNLPLEAVIYAMVLTAFFGIVIGIIRFIVYYNHHRKLCDIKNEITVNDVELPNGEGLLEKDYIDIILSLMEDRRNRVLKSDRQNTERVDYYTMWAHQIKTPIAAMNLLLQTENTDKSGELREELFKIERYVEMVLQYLRTEDMGSDLLIKRYDLYSIVKKSVKKYAKSFFLKNISLRFEPFSCLVLTDEKWFLFVVEQILSNSLKYTHQNGIISIYLDKVMPKTLVIEDNGIGIREEDLPRVFQKGFTGYNGRADKKSTGIGLYLSQKIMKRLSHKIIIESKVGFGTKVKMNLNSVETMIE